VPLQGFSKAVKISFSWQFTPYPREKNERGAAHAIRHITLCLLAHALLTVLRAQSQAERPLSEALEEKNHEKSSQPHSPSRTLDEFKRMRGLTVR